MYLGTDAPVETIEDVYRRLDPSLIVLSGVTDERLPPVLPELRALAGRYRLALGGAAAQSADLEALGFLALASDLIAEADAVTALAQRDERR